MIHFFGQVVVPPVARHLLGEPKMKVEIVFRNGTRYTDGDCKEIGVGLKGSLECLTAEDVKSEIRKVECVHYTWHSDPDHAEEACLFDKLFYFYCYEHPCDVGILFDYGDSKEFLCYESKASSFDIPDGVKCVEIH